MLLSEEREEELEDRLLAAETLLLAEELVRGADRDAEELREEEERGCDTEERDAEPEDRPRATEALRLPDEPAGGAERTTEEPGELEVVLDRAGEERLEYSDGLVRTLGVRLGARTEEETDRSEPLELRVVREG